MNKQLGLLAALSFGCGTAASGAPIEPAHATLEAPASPPPAARVDARADAVADPAPPPLPSFGAQERAAIEGFVNELVATARRRDTEAELEPRVDWEHVEATEAARGHTFERQWTDRARYLTALRAALRHTCRDSALETEPFGPSPRTSYFAPDPAEELYPPPAQVAAAHATRARLDRSVVVSTCTPTLGLDHGFQLIVSRPIDGPLRVRGFLSTSTPGGHLI